MRQLQITYDGPQFVELSCSDKPTQAELISTKVRDNIWPFTLKYCFHPIQGTGKDGLYFCGSDWCNSSKKTLPATTFVVILSILSAFHWNKYVIAAEVILGETKTFVLWWNDNKMPVIKLCSACRQNNFKMEKSLRVLEKYGISNVEIDLSTLEIRKAKTSSEQSHHYPSSELKSRQVSSSFINNFNEKLVYVGEPLENSDEFEEVTKKSRRWRHIDVSGMRMTRWGMTIMSKMIYLETLILDNCALE